MSIMTATKVTNNDNINVVEFKARPSSVDYPLFKVNKMPAYTTCKHNQLIVDVATNSVECGDCLKVLDPMWVLIQLSDKHNYLCRRYDEIKEISEKANAKNRCKCEKCGQMTRIVK